MPLPSKKTTFTFNHSDQVDNFGEDTNDSAQVKGKLDSRGQELLDYINSIYDKLNSVVDGDSGADAVKATAVGESGTTIQSVLDYLYTQIGLAIAGNIADGSIQKAKLHIDLQTEINNKGDKDGTIQADLNADKVDDKEASGTLDTTEQTNLVGAINEVNAAVDNRAWEIITQGTLASDVKSLSLSDLGIENYKLVKLVLSMQTTNTAANGDIHMTFNDIISAFYKYTVGDSVGGYTMYDYITVQDGLGSGGDGIADITINVASGMVYYATVSARTYDSTSVAASKTTGVGTCKTPTQVSKIDIDISDPTYSLKSGGKYMLLGVK